MAHDTDEHSPECAPTASPDGLNRRGFLECMAWAGTGLVWTVAGGVLSSRALAQPTGGPSAPGEFRFVQISDTHIGFKGDANPDVLGT
jgi:Icc protein